MHIEPILLRRRVLQHVPVRQLRNVAVPFGQVGGAAVQVGDVGLAGADGVVGVAEDGGGFGSLRLEVTGGEADEAVGLVFDVVFEVEVVLLGRGSGESGRRGGMGARRSIFGRVGDSPDRCRGRRWCRSCCLGIWIRGLG